MRKFGSIIVLTVSILVLALSLTMGIASAQVQQATVGPAQPATANPCGNPTPEQLNILENYIIYHTYLPGPPLAGSGGNVPTSTSPTVPGSLSVATNTAISQMSGYFQLSDSQTQAVTSIKSAYEDFAAKARGQISDLRQHIATLRAQASLDAASIGQDYASIEVLYRQMQDEAGRSRDRIVALLTDEQRSKLTTLQNALQLVPYIQAAQCSGMIP